MKITSFKITTEQTHLLTWIYKINFRATTTLQPDVESDYKLTCYKQFSRRLDAYWAAQEEIKKLEEPSLPEPKTPQIVHDSIYYEAMLYRGLIKDTTRKDDY